MKNAIKSIIIQNPEITREIGDFRILLSPKIKHILKCTSISIKSN